MNNITRSYTYDGVGRLTNEAISGSMDLNMAYTYDIRGNRTKKTVTGDESYTITSFYNYNDRLTSSTKRVNGVISEMDQYGYDSNGNQVSKMHTDYGTASLSDVGEAMRNDHEYFAAAPEEEEAPEMIMDEAEEAELEEDEPEGIYFGGDEAAESIGDIIPEAETKADEPDITEYIPDDTAELMDTAATTETFTYNARNQLTAYENTATGTSASYTYGANGLRKSKTVGSATTDFIWNGSNLAAEKVSGSIQNIYSYGTDGIAISNINGTLSYYLKDAHGNVVGTTNMSGVQNKSYNFDAFGNQFNAVLSSDTNPFRYCGEYYDNESGNIYLRARYYDTATGRFISEDPAKDGLNWYSYCAGNPVMAVDPSGLGFIGLRETIEGLGGSVTWNSETNQANVYLDGEIIKVYEGDDLGTYNDNGTLYVDDEKLFAAFAMTYDLGKGWTARIERATYGGNYNSKHVHVTRGDETYSQNDDGSPHDGSTGSPPNKVKKRLKEATGWDWDANESDYIDRINSLLKEEYNSLYITPIFGDVTGIFIIEPAVIIPMVP